MFKGCRSFLTFLSFFDTVFQKILVIQHQGWKSGDPNFLFRNFTTVHKRVSFIPSCKQNLDKFEVKSEKGE